MGQQNESQSDVAHLIWEIPGADKSLVRPGRKKDNVSVTMAWIFFGTLPCRKKKLMTARVSMLLKSRSSLTCFRACFLPGLAKDLSAPRYLSNSTALRHTVPATHEVEFYTYFSCTWRYSLIQNGNILAELPLPRLVLKQEQLFCTSVKYTRTVAVSNSHARRSFVEDMSGDTVVEDMSGDTVGQFELLRLRYPTLLCCSD